MYIIKMQHAYSHFIRFYRYFCIDVDFYYVPFRHSCPGLMTLPTDVKRQCHHNVGQCRQVNSKVLPHTIFHIIIPVILIFRGEILHTSM